MECLAVFLLLVILIAVMMTWASQAHVGAERWSRAFLAVAVKHGGWHSSGGWFGRPTARFRYGGTTVVVDSVVGGRPKRRYLQVRINFPDATLRCEAFPRRMEPRLPFLGMTDSATGAVGFDTEYVVRGDDREQTRRFFSDGVQLQLNRLRYMLGNDNIYLAVQRGQLLAKKEFPRHGGVDQITELVQITLDLYDQAILTRSAAIHFLEQETLQPIDQCVCMVCGDELLEDVVLCRRCKTPHHRDCWMYYGACSTYGCREPEFMIPRVAPLAFDPPQPQKPVS